jgi:hypothetical protein
MKTIYNYFLSGMFLLLVINTSAQNSANTTLSNLISPTKINVDLLPDKNNKRNLGSYNREWKNFYLDSFIYLAGRKFLASPAGGSGGNTAVGFYALDKNTSGDYNTANGFFTLYENTTGSNNTALGSYALYLNTSGSYNTAIGTGSGESFLGSGALYQNTSGSYNSAVGVDALSLNYTGNYNTAVGAGALFATTSSEYNTAVGDNAGAFHDNGWNNVFVGANTDVNGTGYYNDIAIGQGTLCTDVSQARFGNSATVSIGGYVGWSNISDGRVKKNIKQNVPGLAFINKLQPITYTLDLEAADRITQPPVKKDKDGKTIQPSQQELSSRKAKEQIVYTGFIAQDVEKSAKELNYDFSGVDAAKNSKDLYGLRYAEFVVPLVKAVQELDENQKSESKSQDDAIAVLQNENNEIKERIEKLETLMNMQLSATSRQPQNTNLNLASLEQNIPNPFKSSTIINYLLPASYSSAEIIITDKKGVVIKQVNLNSKGKGNIQVDASTLASGAYQYSLYVDGKIIDTKQLVLTK